MNIEPVFGLDIGSFTIKAAQVKYRGNSAELEAASIIDLPEKVSTLLETNQETLAKTIRKAVSSSKPRPINTKYVVSALPESKVYTEIITVPKMKDEELKSALPLEAAKHMPMPLEESYLDYSLVEKTNEKLKVLTIAAPRKLVDKVYRLVQSIGLELVALETKPISGARALINEELKKNFILIFDIGAENSSFTITNNDNIIFAVTLSSGGENYVKAVSSALKITREKALSMAKLAKNPQTKDKILKVLYPLFENTVAEIQKAIKYYQTNTPEGREIKKILLAGGGSITPGLAEYIAQSISIETEIANPFTNLTPSDLSRKIPPEEASTLTTSIGLALRKIQT